MTSGEGIGKLQAAGGEDDQMRTPHAYCVPSLRTDIRRREISRRGRKFTHVSRLHMAGSSAWDCPTWPHDDRRSSVLPKETENESRLATLTDK